MVTLTAAAKRSPAHSPHIAPNGTGVWNTLPCQGCKRPLATPDGEARLCPECREACYEGLAHAVDPAYDPRVVNEWDRCAGALAVLYGAGWDDPRGAVNPGWSVPVVRE